MHWDLNVFYSGIDDPQLGEDIAAFEQMAKNFRTVYKGNLSRKLGMAIFDYSKLAMLHNKISGFLSLRQSLNVIDATVKAKVAEVDRVTSAVYGEYLEFFYLELAALDDTALEPWYQHNPLAKKHKPWIEHIRVLRPHMLSEPVESALTKRQPFGTNAWSEFFDECEADLTFLFDKEKKTLTEMLHILTTSKDAEERFEAMRAINHGLGGSFAKYAAQTLYMITGSNVVENRDRSFAHPMARRNKSNDVPDEVVDALHRVVEKEAAPLTKRFYRLKGRLLRIKPLRWSDRNAPMPFTDTTAIPFEEGLELVKAAYRSFSPTLAGLVEAMAQEQRIDAPVVKGKRSGAFNASLMLPSNIPVSYTLLNYLGSSRDVMTLAHELGHGVHGLLAAKEQGVLMFQAPIAYCETASVFGEMTTFRFLKDRLAAAGDQHALLALLIEKLDDMANTVVRQICFSNFERRLHGMDSSLRTWDEVKKHSVEEINAIWLEATKQLYGEEGEVFTYEETEHLWSYVHHFHSPFYVYGYAFGELLTQSLYAQQPKYGDRFEPLYLDLLRAGGTKNAVQLLAPLDLDPTREQFWSEGLRVGYGALLDEAEKLSRAMGIF